MNYARGHTAPPADQYRNHKAGSKQAATPAQCCGRRPAYSAPPSRPPKQA